MGRHYHSLQDMRVGASPRQSLPPRPPPDRYENRPLPPVPFRNSNLRSVSMNGPIRITSQEKSSTSPPLSGSQISTRTNSSINQTTTLSSLHPDEQTSERSTASSAPSPPCPAQEMMKGGGSTCLLSASFAGSPSPRSNAKGSIEKPSSHDIRTRDALQIQTQDLHLTCQPPTFLDDTSSSVYSLQDDEGETISEPARTLSLLDTFDAARHGHDAQCLYSPAGDYPSWVPASPVPPNIDAFPLDRTTTRRYRYGDRPAVTTTPSPLSPVSIAESLHHFETIPARRNNYNDYSAVGARDLYHATMTQIALSTQSQTKSQAEAEAQAQTHTPPLGTRPSSLQSDDDFTVAPHIAPWLQGETSSKPGKQGNDSPSMGAVHPPLPLHLRKQNQKTFATRVRQTARKSPPSSVKTQGLAPPFTFERVRTLTPPGTALSLPLALGSPSVQSQFEDEGKSRAGRYSEAFSRVFRRSGSGEKQQPPRWRRNSDGSGTPGGIIGTRSEHAGARGPHSSPLLASGQGVLQKTQEQWHGLVAQARKTAGAMAMSREERKREALRGKIRVIHEAASDI